MSVSIRELVNRDETVRYRDVATPVSNTLDHTVSIHDLPESVDTETGEILEVKTRKPRQRKQKAEPVDFEKGKQEALEREAANEQDGSPFNE